ncbi:MULTISPECIES: hypothetical protein [Micromonospora]|jgi:hypothetical protein|uniref:Uncharacterized protein n=1 Tax=Micromonospora sicca TaxID=2202420 RepID=A0ABU5J963_9ACTN|nr:MULTISPECIES: hypothetical protein [unclassified Micromonospora]MDZ5442260.1 hypothetical protein [Micromonospora sp. 4G57]MDZ5489065.1 hypothetical protein [Micromonospora sp. 4G53]
MVRNLLLIVRESCRMAVDAFLVGARGSSAFISPIVSRRRSKGNP